MQIRPSRRLGAPKRRRPRVLLASLAALTLVGATGAASASPSGPGGKSSATASFFQSDPQGFTPARLDALGAGHFPAAYGGVVEVNGGHHLDVYLTSLRPSVEGAFRREAARGDLTFLRTPHSMRHTLAIHHRVIGKAGQLRRLGVRLIEWWPKIQTGREMIGVEHLRARDVTLLDRMLGSSNISVFDVPPSNMPVPAAGRAYDGPPWKGGDYLGDGHGCTSAFGVKIAGANRLLSAAHCWTSGTSVYNYNVDGGGTYRFVGVVRQRLTKIRQLDAEAIAANSADRVYVGGIHSTTTATIRGKTSNPVGAYVQNDGAYSGETSLLRVSARNMCIDIRGFRTACGEVEANSSNGRVAQETGDSGGPVIRVISGRVYAAGIDSAYFTGQDIIHCTYNKAQTCSTDLLYANIDDSLTQLHAVLKTG